jgi:hypothetical protein
MMLFRISISQPDTRLGKVLSENCLRIQQISFGFRIGDAKASGVAELCFQTRVVTNSLCMTIRDCKNG